MRDQKGFSLIELIVVVLIMAIVVGTASMGISVVYNADTQRAAERFISAMKTSRQNAKAAVEEKTLTVKLVKESGGFYAVTYLDSDETAREFLANDRMEIKVGPKETSSETGSSRTGIKSITGTSDTDSVTYTFKKSTGGIIETGQEDIYFLNGNEVHVIAVDITGRFYLK